MSHKLCGATSVRTCRYFAQPCSLFWELLLVWVDPLLRGKIWQYLTNLSKKENTTVLITTHFIEEAREADAIGFMRSGRLLAEGKPVELMQIHGTIKLEDVFINLCKQGFFC